MMEGKDPPPLNVAAHRAISLCGREALRQEIDGQEVKKVIAENVRLFGLSGKRLPRVFGGLFSFAGVPPNEDKLFRELERYFSIRPLAP